jgi:hypothetical protein
LRFGEVTLMADSAPETRVDPQKRRSARIVQAVPLTVTGVDALGRPFQERTSTVAINCHGCRYQSKHYVLKNMWVMLEVPHPEPGHEPRSVRARVTWIQRPRTVRELFQIGVELEMPGNLWGIAFPQHDWFPFPDDAGFVQLPEREQSDKEWTLKPAASQDNLRVLPVGEASETPSTLTQQMARLLNEAQQQLQVAVRQSAGQAVAEETGPLLAALKQQLQEEAEQSIPPVAESAVKQALQEALGQSLLESEECLKQTQQRWTEDLLAAVERARGNLTGRLDELEQERHAAFGQQLEILVQQARSQLAHAFRDGEAILAQSREAGTVFRQQAEAVAASAFRDTEQRLRTKVEETQSGWHARLHADLTAATELWNQRIESSLESAAQKSAERLARNSQAAAERIENELGSRLSSFGKTFAEATAEAEKKLGTLHTSAEGKIAQAQDALSQLQSAALRVEEQATRFDAITQNAQQELERRAAALLEAQSQELGRRAEGTIAAWAERLQPPLEAAGQQIVARLREELDRELDARVQRAGQACARLERGITEGGNVLLRQQEALAKASDQVVETARGRLQEALDRMAQEFEELGRAASARWLGEIDAKATDTTHTTFESLFKTADWYEKKVQVQMQTALEKGLDLAGANLREKAGEISALFASELDHYSRSYVEHARGQLDEATREAVTRVQQRAAELAMDSVAALTKQTQSHADSALADVRSKAAAALAQISAQAAAQLAQVQTEIDQEGRRLSSEFRDVLALDGQQCLAVVRNELGSLAEGSLDRLRSEGHAQQAQLTQALATLSDQAMEEYRKRLGAASNSWLLTTVSKLDQQSQQQIQVIAQAAEERLRETCAHVFAAVGENLRRQLLDVAPPSGAKGAAASAK